MSYLSDSQRMDWAFDYAICDLVTRLLAGKASLYEILSRKICEEKMFKHPRKRYRHEWQNHTHENSVTFAKSRKEDILTGPFSILEYFVLANIVDSCEDNGLETDAPTILSIYNQVVSINSDINPRKQPDIEHFMQLYKNNLTMFSRLCHNQVQSNFEQ